MRIEEGVELARFTTLGTGGPARALARPESEAEVEELLRDLKAHGCSMVTLGQYLPPSGSHLPLERYAPPEEFAHYRAYGLSLGFRQVASGPLVRSSYHADEQAGETLHVP